MMNVLGQYNTHWIWWTRKMTNEQRSIKKGERVPGKMKSKHHETGEQEGTTHWANINDILWTNNTKLPNDIEYFYDFSKVSTP